MYVCVRECVIGAEKVPGEEMGGKVVSISSCMNPLYLSVTQTLGWAAGGRKV